MQVMEKAADLRKMKYNVERKRGSNLAPKVPSSLISVPAAAGAQGERGHGAGTGGDLITYHTW